MNDRDVLDSHDQAAIRLARECRDGTLDLAAMRTPIGLTSTPSDGATAGWRQIGRFPPAGWDHE